MQTHKRAKRATVAAAIRSRRGLCVMACLLALFVWPWSARSVFLGPLTAISTIDFNGNNVTIDSFDSGDPHHSDWQTNMTYHGTNFYGFYPANPTAPSGDPNPYEPYKRKDNACIATDGQSIGCGNANVFGYVDAAPGGTVTVGANGSVGDVFWVPTQGIQPGHVRDDMNVTFPDVVLPPNFPTSQNVTKLLGPRMFLYAGFAFNYVITNSGYYRIDDNPVKSPIYIKATNVFLYFPYGLNFHGNANNSTIYLETNSDVTIYTGGDIDTSGNTGINNITQYAPAFVIYGLPGCTQLYLAGNGSIVAYVYAPEAYLHMGGIIGTYAAVGAFFVHNIQTIGNMAFHFDESLSLITSLPLGIITQPKNQAVAAGSNITFSVSTGGGAPMNYRWFFNQTNLLASGTNSSLSLTNVQLTDAGNYSVIVTNVFNAVTSTPASLIVYTDATPTLSVPCISTNGQCQFYITGVTGLNYTVQASTNLVDWIPLLTNSSPFSFVDTNVGLFPQRFYRSVYLP